MNYQTIQKQQLNYQNLVKKMQPLKYQEKRGTKGCFKAFKRVRDFQSWKWKYIHL